MKLKFKLHSIILLATFLCVVVCFSCIHKKHRYKLPPGGCCLAGGTFVHLANGKDVYIENIVVGDTVLGFDKTNDSFVPSIVKKLFTTEHAGFSKLNFAALYRNGLEIFPTRSIIISNDHPIWVKEKGWCSLEPEMTKRILLMKPVSKIKVNDLCYTNMDLSMAGLAGNVMLISIEKIKEPIKAYTIVELDNKLDCFFANGIVVGTESLQMENGGE